MKSEKQPPTDAKVLAIPAGQESLIEPVAQVQGKGSLENLLKTKINIKQPNRLWILVLLLGWVFDLLFWERSVGINFALFSSLCLIGGMTLLFAEGHRPARTSLWLLLPFAFFVTITFVRQEPLTIFLAYTITILGIGLLAITYLGGRWFRYEPADYFNKLLRLFAGAIYLPMEFRAQVRKEQLESNQNKKSLNLWPFLRGVAIALPIVTIFAALLASADMVFSQKLGDFFDLFNFGNLAEYFLRLILISICAYILGGSFLYAASQSRDEEITAEHNLIVKPFLGFTEASVVLGSVSILFIVFVIIQFQYFFGGETNIGVTGYTYSQYARRGFNELVIVAFFSLVMILGLSTITQREKETEKRVYSGLGTGLVALVMIILVSAYQRISLAIDWHGFSRLRLYPRVFLIWLAVLLLAVVLLEIFQRERYFAFAAILASLGFAVSLTLTNVDAAIVRHNVPRVLEGKNLNVSHLASLSFDAVPALVEEYTSSSYSQDVHEGIGAALLCYLNTDSFPGAYDRDWRAFNLSRWRAHIALQSVQASLQEYGIKRFPWRVRTPGNALYECHYDSSREME
jgi:hypothetical protein